jgi:hypothetical protein
MSLTQIEANSLLALAKIFDSEINRIDFSRGQPFANSYLLEGVGRREAFLFDIERGNRKRARLKFQTRARKVCILARIDIDGKPHTNPPESPHRPGQRFVGPHIHLYREGFEDRVAFHPHEVPGFQVPSGQDDVAWLVAFLEMCNVSAIPQIQELL